MLQVECFGFTTGNAVHVLVRDFSGEAVVVQEESLDAGEDGGEFSGEGIVAEIDDGIVAVGCGGGSSGGDPTGEIVPLQQH